MQDVSRLVVPLAFAAAAGIGAIAIMFTLMRLSRVRRSREAAPPFTLGDLRGMRSRGEISEREFQALRAQVLHMSGKSDRAAPAERRREADSEE